MPPPPIHSSSSPEAVNEACQTFNLSAAELSTLRERAQANKARAYCPYSKFRVGAVLLTQDGTFIDGANVENASYPVGTCAERVAFGRAIVDGHGRKGGFKAVAVATDLTAPGSPCGMCRQFMREFCDLSMPIFMFDKNDNFSVLRLEELLPLSFGPDKLGVPDSAQRQAEQA